MPRKSPVEEDHPSVQVELMIPVRQCGRAKQMEKARGPAAAAVPKLPRIPRVTRLMALAIKLQDMLERGELRDYADIARLGHVTRARVSQIMNLLLLAPDIQEEILGFRDCCRPILERDLREVTAEPDWRAQTQLWSAMRGANA